MNKLKSIIQDFGWLIMGPVGSFVQSANTTHACSTKQKHRNSSKAVHIM